ncbi:restriction endonuclease [Polaromonas sp.]|uniref:restriction endonuclease n=1 Tax=Polaromonas sp. TaxID=1869339 RepID=UPI00352A1024
MIEDPNPKDWRELQAGVCRLLNEIGLTAETEKALTTPRGEVEVDVYAVDQASVDKIKYIVECKNWAAAIPQTVVHAFTTVMSETGANIGFIVSQKGLQRGAEKYTDSTNIIGMTYLELQQRYFDVWWEKCFCRQVGDMADEMMDFVEPYNPRRDELAAELTPEKAERFNGLQRCFGTFCMVMTQLNMGRYTNLKEWSDRDSKLLKPPESLDEYKATVLSMWSHFEWDRVTNFRDLKVMIEEIVTEAHQEFRAVFGGEVDEVYDQRATRTP